MPNWYCTRDALKDRIAITRTDADAAIDQIIESVSRQIDLWCGTHFFVRNRTRYFTYQAQRRDRDAPLLLHTELVSIDADGLKTDSAGDRTYATTWATTDYDLHPESAPYESPPAPYWAIYRAPGGANGWYTGRRSIQIAGKWGHYEVLERSSTTLAAAVVSTSATTLTLSASPTVEVGQTIRIDSEQMFVSALSGVTATVTRGVNGTTAATHLINSVIDVYTYPVVGESCLTQCQRRYEGTIGRPNRGEQEAIARAYARLDRDVQDALSLVRYRGA